jgi:hypothetical protein
MKQLSLKSSWTTRVFPAAMLTLLAVSCSSEPVSKAAGDACCNPGQADNNHVRILTRREGDVTRFFVKNDEYCEVTMTFEMHTLNLNGTAQFPYTTTIPLVTRLQFPRTRKSKPSRSARM